MPDAIVKWRGYHSAAALTLEPPHNVHVARVETPVLCRTAPDYEVCVPRPEGTWPPGVGHRVYPLATQEQLDRLLWSYAQRPSQAPVPPPSPALSAPVPVPPVVPVDDEGAEPSVWGRPFPSR